MKCLASIMYDSVILCYELIQSYNEEKIFNEKKATCKTQNFYILLIFSKPLFLGNSPLIHPLTPPKNWIFQLENRVTQNVVTFPIFNLKIFTEILSS